jgi:hypothetical protein
LTGKTDLKLKIYRQSDGRYLDFADQTFKPALSVTLMLQSLTEVDAVNLSGLYRYLFNTAAIINPMANDVYTIEVLQTPGTDVANLPIEGEIHVGNWLDRVDVNVSSRMPSGPLTVTVDAASRLAIADAVWNELLASHTIAGSASQFVTLIQKLLRNRLELTNGNINNWILYDDDSATPLLKWNVTDVNGTSIAISAGVPARRTKGV